MKAILVPVEQHTSPAVFHAALAVARPFDSYVEGIASGPRVPDVIITDVGTLPILEPDTRRELATNARQQFEAWMISQSVPPRPEEPHGLCFGWHGDELIGNETLGCLSRAFDLIVVGRPGPSRDETRMATVESALIDRGRPVLVVPPSISEPATLGDRGKDCDRRRPAQEGEG